MPTTRVAGINNQNKVMVYSLSTCVWCKKTKKLLQDLDVQFDYIDVDLSTKEDRKKMRRKTLSYPLIIINDQIEINGYNEENIRKTLNP
jgi:glutaredoxin